MPTGAQTDFGSFTAPHTERNFLRYRRALFRHVDVIQRLHIGDQTPDLQRNAGGRDQASRSGIHKFVLIARGIKIAQHQKLDPVGFQVALQRFERFRVLRL